MTENVDKWRNKMRLKVFCLAMLTIFSLATSYGESLTQQTPSDDSQQNQSQLQRAIQVQMLSAYGAAIGGAEGQAMQNIAEYKTIHLNQAPLTPAETAENEKNLQQMIMKSQASTLTALLLQNPVFLSKLRLRTV